MQKKLIKVNPTDNVAVALVNLAAAEEIYFEGKDIKIISDVKMKHKIALVDLNIGDPIIMYGVLVGKASVQGLKSAWLCSQHHLSLLAK